MAGITVVAANSGRTVQQTIGVFEKNFGTDGTKFGCSEWYEIDLTKSTAGSGILDR